MKCLCGYEEPEAFEEETPVYFQSGKRKGELKHIDTKWIEPNESEKFIRVGIEKDFSFTRHYETWRYTGTTAVDLYACSRCGTVKMEIE